VLSVGLSDSDSTERGFGAYSAGVTRVYNHSVPEFASFFGPLELVPPGVVDAREWRPDWEQAVHLPPRDGQAIVGVARIG
jgi:S-adenosyl methyltransferase